MADILKGVAYKTCTKCRESKPAHNFHKNKNFKDGRMNICASCRRKYKKDYYKKTIDRQRKRSRVYYSNHKDKAANYQLKSKYGIDLKTKEELLKFQDYRCKICSCPLCYETAKVDHDHNSGRIRGILCSNCNLALGLLHDDTCILNNMIEYLKGNTDERY